MQVRMSLIPAVLVCVALGAVASARQGPRWHDLTAAYTIEHYARDFARPYAGRPRHLAAEYDARAAIFAENLATILRHNAAGRSWQMGVNDFTDRSAAERRAVLGVRGAQLTSGGIPPPERNYTPYRARELPDAVSWRYAVPAVLTAVKNQGRCGSCWAHAAAQTIESQHAIATSRQANGSAADAELWVLSQQQITACTPNPNHCGGSGGCGGATAEAGIVQMAAMGGIAQEWTNPYTAYFGDSGVCNGSYPYRVAKVTGYTKVAENSQADLMNAIAFAGPPAVVVDASKWHFYESGVFDNCSYAHNVTINHAVQATGYGRDAATGLHFWEIRNSWGGAWGENGYIRMIRATTDDCGWNVNPTVGNGCAGDTEPVWVCGTCAVAYDAIMSNPDLPQRETVPIYVNPPAPPLPAGAAATANKAGLVVGGAVLGSVLTGIAAVLLHLAAANRRRSREAEATKLLRSAEST